MARDLTAAMEAALGAANVRWALLFEGQFDSGTLRFWSGLGDLSHGGQTYTGAGNLIGVGAVRESSDLRNDAMQVELSGIPSELISIALSEDYQGRSIIVSLAVFDASGAIIADPTDLINGFADQMTISDSGETASIRISVESEVARFERASLRRYTAASLKEDYPGDKGLDFASLLSNQDIVWGGGKSGGGERQSNVPAMPPPEPDGR